MSAIKLPVRIEDGQFLVGADNELVAHLLSADEAEMREIVTLMNQGYKEPVPQSATRKVEVCTRCGSANIQRDAWVHANDPEDVRTFDDTFCENCESSCKTRTVTVPADFDIYSDIYTEGE